MRRRGINPNRSISRGRLTAGATQDLEQIRSHGPAPTLQTAVVLDVVMDPGMLSEEQTSVIRDTVNNPIFADVLTPNCIIAKLTSANQGIAFGSNTILFPLFSSHLMLPVQPGETVTVVYNDPEGDAGSVGYWVTRTPAQRTVEDVNYTHYDRRFDPALNPSNFSTGDRSDRGSRPEIPGFPNGGNTDESRTLATYQQSEPGLNTYEEIIGTSAAFRHGSGPPVVTPEPVPRWRKRPQELVFQGCNNTLISLGEDRKGGPLGAIEGPAPRDAKGQSGTIDIVAGRGRIAPPDENTEPARTACRVTRNARDYRETNKASYLRRSDVAALDDPREEGDPDYLNDAARVLVSMQSDADRNFGVDSREYPPSTLSPAQPEEGSPGGVSRGIRAVSTNKSYVVAKADHLRLIARADGDNGIEGTLMLLREGASGDDLGYVFMAKDGIQVEHKKIYLGKATGEDEPYIKWTEFKNTVDHLQTEIDKLKLALQTQLDSSSTALSALTTALDLAFSTAVAIPFAPVPSLTALASASTTALASGPHAVVVGTEKGRGETAVINGKNETDRSVEAAKSEKIFGE
jgi:hypothetical protein